AGRRRVPGDEQPGVQGAGREAARLGDPVGYGARPRCVPQAAGKGSCAGGRADQGHRPEAGRMSGGITEKIMATQKLGFIGVGNMGGPMSGHLLKAGYELVVFDTSDAAVGKLTAQGA